MNRSFSNHQTVGRLLQFGFRSWLAVVLAVGWGAAASYVGVEAQTPSAAMGVTLTGPERVEVGQVIRLSIGVSHGDATALPVVGGVEAHVRFDPEAAEFAAFYPQTPQHGMSVARLAAPQLATGSAVGFYACGTAACMGQREVQAAATVAVSAAGEGAPLLEVELLALHEGVLEVGLEQVIVVGVDGMPLPVRVGDSETGMVLRVQVGEGADVHGLPASGWRVYEASAAGVASADVTGDGRVRHGDVMEVALAWQARREAGNPCGGEGELADINGDGCVDVVDVQRVAAAASSATETGSDSLAEGDTATEIAALPQHATEYDHTFTVNSMVDEPDAEPGDGNCLTASGVCTLRAAIREANTREGSVAILFDIPGEEAHTIQLTESLPTLNNETGPVLIDGYSQPDASSNTDPHISNAQIRIELRGAGSENFDGMVITSGGNTVRGLAFYDFKRAIWIYGPGAQDNVIVGNFVGTDAAAEFRFTVMSTQQAHGIHIEQGAYRNQIGGPTPAERNVVSGNARHGIGFWHVGTDQNHVLNNIVGLSPDGARGMPNQGHGVDFNFGAARNILGGEVGSSSRDANNEEATRNILSGNIRSGAEISHAAETTQNRIVGNYIGTDVTGDRGPAYAANREAGVSLTDRVNNNLVANNVIGNNRGGGVFIDDFGNCCTRGNALEGNRIGIGVDGSLVPNEEYGVRIMATQTRIGPGNIIAYNPAGILIEGENSTGNTVTLNSVFGNIGLGIDIEPIGQVNLNDPNEQGSGPNLKLNYPEFDAATPEQLIGTACGGCRIEVFIADGRWFHHGQGQTFVGATVAGADGAFAVELQDVQFGHYLTATATDEEGNTSEFSQNLLVRDPNNQPPVAVDDTAHTYIGQPVIIDVLANDSDPEGDPLFIVAVDLAQNGLTTTDGELVTYSPNEGFVGVDSFTYTISDGMGGIDTATVTVTVEDFVGTGQAIVSPMELTLIEGGEAKSYTIVLSQEPAAPVTITVTVVGQQLVVDRNELVFDAGNWHEPQAVTVAAVAPEDAGAAQLPESMIQHTSHSDDEHFNGLDLPSVAVQIVEAQPVILLPWLLSEGD